MPFLFLSLSQRIGEGIEHLYLFTVGIATSLTELREDFSVGNMEEEIEREKQEPEEEGQRRDLIEPGDQGVVEVEKESFFAVEIAPERDARYPEEKESQPTPHVKGALPEDHMQSYQTRNRRKEPSEIRSKKRYESALQIVFLGEENEDSRKNQKKTHDHRLS